MAVPDAIIIAASGHMDRCVIINLSADETLFILMGRGRAAGRSPVSKQCFVFMCE